ncbi:hypothetical protein Aperf_G00000048677 [Anoplocephala perfoliata]
MDSLIMDSTDYILSPPVFKVGNTIYRKNPTKILNSLEVPVGHLNEDYDVNEQTTDKEFTSDQTCHFVEDIKAVHGGFEANFYVPPVFYPLIIGTDHAKQRKLESEFSCRLHFGDYQSTHDQIKITARSEGCIFGVARRIAWIVSEARPKMKPTHFVCLPVIDDTVKEKYLAFKNEICELAKNGLEGSFRGIDSDLFVSVHKLHFTLATLFLADEREVRLASQLLTSFMDTIDEGKAFDRSPLFLTIRGVDTMNDDPRSVSVLFMRLQENVQSRRLQNFANGIADMFSRHGLHSGHRCLGEPVKLHLTILNSRLRAQRQACRSDGSILLADSCTSEPFCALGTLQAFETRCLVENGRFEEVMLCKMVSDTAEDDDGTCFYPCIAKLTWSAT